MAVIAKAFSEARGRPPAADSPHVAAADRHLAGFVATWLDLLNGLAARLDVAAIRTHVGLTSPEFVAALTTPAALAKAVTTAGLEAQFTTVAFDAGASLELGGDLGLVNDMAVRYAKERGAELVGGIDAETRTLIARVVARGQAGKLSSDQVAKEVRQLIGLTPAQAAAAQNFRAHLQGKAAGDLSGKATASATAGQFALSPWQGGKLDQAKIDKLYAQYVDRLKRDRAETIARTETIRAADAGARMAWQAKIKAGDADGMILVRTWSVTRDDRACQACLKLDGETVQSAPSFPGAPADLAAMQAFPGGHRGPPAHPRCRCVVMNTLEPAPAGAWPAPAAPPAPPAVEEIAVDPARVAEYAKLPLSKLKAKLHNTLTTPQERAEIKAAMVKVKFEAAVSEWEKLTPESLQVTLAQPELEPGVRAEVQEALRRKQEAAAAAPPPPKPPAAKPPAPKPKPKPPAVKPAPARPATGPRSGWASPGDPAKVTPDSARAVRVAGSPMIHKPGDPWSRDKSAAARSHLEAQGPSGKLLAKTLRDFQHDSGPANVKNLRRNIDAEIKGQSQSAAGQTRARVFLETLRGVDPDVVPKTLYRGMRIKGTPQELAARYQKYVDDDAPLDLGISSFSDDDRVMRNFARSGPDETSVHVTVEGETRGIPVRNLASMQGFADESEWISAGRYRIKSVGINPRTQAVEIKMTQESVP